VGLALAVAALVAFAIGMVLVAGRPAVRPGKAPKVRRAAVARNIPVPRAPAEVVLPTLPPLPAWIRHLPGDLPPPRDGGAGAGADFRGRLVQPGRFAGLPLSDAVFAGAELLQADFARADLDGADFRGADLTQADFAGADLAGAQFDEAKLHQTRFVGRDTAAVAGRTRVRDGITERVPPPPLVAAHLGQASFRGARFTQLSLDGADLAGADFAGAEFTQVTMRGADLGGADLSGTRHHSTDFEGAKLGGADLRGADLSWASNLTAAQLASARTDATTRRPRQ
jgi:uncharacterized protein YjbI with pentapeptide repeats